MSHFTTVKTKINNLTALKQALENLKYKFSVAEENQQSADSLKRFLGR